MQKHNYITAQCRIQNNEMFVDGQSVFKTQAADFAEFSKKAYQHLGLSYPKFFKMDNLSKLAFLGAELLLKSDHDDSNTALVFANKSASLDTDVKYQQSIADPDNYFPSPAVFVYTLPNICVGEISIRHQLKSENSFFIFDAFNSSLMANYANLLINTEKADKVLGGWVEYFNENYEAFLWLVSAKGSAIHNQQSLETAYNQ
jgi:hypothetical protein